MWFTNSSGRAVTSIFRCNSKLYEFSASALKFLLTLITTRLVIGFYPQLCVFCDFVLLCVVSQKFLWREDGGHSAAFPCYYFIYEKQLK